MPTLTEIISEKVTRLDSVPDKLQSSIAKSQKKIFEEILVLLDKLDKSKTGEILTSVKNIEIIEEIIDDLKKVFYTSDYTAAVKEFAGEFDTQGKINKSLITKSLETAEFSALSAAVLKAEKKAAVELLLGSSIDKEFFNPIKGTIQDAINSGRPIRELIHDIRIIAEGEEGKLGRLERYAGQIANDAFATADRAHTNAIANELDAEWYRYVGGLLKDSRDFCEDRNNNYYHKKEVEAWGAGDVTAGITNPTETDSDWAGKNQQTDAATIFILLGGFNCKHALIPVLLSAVPPEVVERNVENGNYEQE